MRPGRATDHSPPSSAAVMEEYSYTSTHPLGHTGPVTGKFYLYIYIYIYTHTHTHTHTHSHNEMTTDGTCSASLSTTFYQNLIIRSAYFIRISLSNSVAIR